MHTVTLDEILPALDKEIVLASSRSLRTKQAKDLKFDVSQLRYRVRFYDGTSATSNSYDDINEAIKNYNELNA